MKSAAPDRGQPGFCPEPAVVVKSEPMTELERFYELRLESGKDLGHMPGQFVELSLAGIGESPFGLSTSPTRKGSFELVVRKVGNTTTALHRLQAGDRVGIRGPFGTHFPVESAMRGKDLLFICGGIGLVPVRSAIQYVLDHRGDYGHVTILFGAKSPAERLFIEETKQWQAQPDVDYQETVDRADKQWPGKVGVITILIPPLPLKPERTVAVMCGPPVMYKFVIMELQRLGLPEEAIYVSLERHMKCGLGKCGHCQVNGMYVCQDGPVFRYADVRNVREAI